MCDNCKPENQALKPVEERLKNLEEHQYVLLQSCSKLIDDLAEARREAENAHKAMSSFMLKVCGELPALREGMMTYIESRATNVGEADQIKKLFADLMDKG